MEYRSQATVMGTTIPEASEHWLDASCYEENSKYFTRATDTFNRVNWAAVSDRCCQLRRVESCTLSPKFSIGNFNLARKVSFPDDSGTSWVVRIQLPGLSPVDGRGEVSNDAAALTIEISSLLYLAKKTSIPVPKVHDHSVNADNDFRFPYVIMDYVNGLPAIEMQKKLGFEVDHYGTAEQDKKFREGMALIQIELACSQFDQIGSLYYNKDSEEFYIGPDMDTGKGPWSNSLEYYTEAVAYARHRCKARTSSGFYEKWSHQIPELFLELMRVHARNKEGPFSLTNRDFGAHNILVNENFDILAVIDLNGVMAGPIEVVSQFPTLTGLDLDPPNYEPDPAKPLAVQRLKEVRPRLTEYQRIVCDAELALEKGGTKTSAETPKIGPLMQSTSSLLVTGLDRFHAHQGFVNAMWLCWFKEQAALDLET